MYWASEKKGKAKRRTKQTAFNFIGKAKNTKKGSRPKKLIEGMSCSSRINFALPLRDNFRTTP
jgi:hypothetical protein